MPTRRISVDLRASTALVTGADRGLGREFARQLLGRGAEKVYATARAPETIAGGDPRLLPRTNPFNAPIHALAVVRDQMAARGDLTDPNGVPIPAAEVAPTNLITPGTEVIDGVPFVFEAISGGETTDQLLIRLPEHGVLVAQDLVYHHTHVFVGNNDIARWQVILEELADPAYDTILPGHGLPAGQAVLAEMAEYLEAARELLGGDGAAYKQAIIARFPAYKIPFVIDIGNYYLFGTRPA